MVDISGQVSMPLSAKVESNLVITSPLTKQTSEGGILEFKIPGKFIHFNTIEEFNACDFQEVAEKHGISADVLHNGC